MKDLRSLLIDCRIELRKQSRDFQKSELCDRLDLAIQSTSNAQIPLEPAAEQATTGQPSEKTQTAGQVALAWQTAARDLKFSDPAIHARLGEKVMRLLGAKTLVDPAQEIILLEQQVAALKEQIAVHEKKQQSLQMECDTVQGALAKAVPSLKDGGDRLAVTLARLAWLKAEADKAGKPGAAPAAAKRAPEPQDTVPTQELLTAAAAGAATFTKEQREWCVGEAMVLTGFQFTPVELIEQGDQRIAEIILKARASG